MMKMIELVPELEHLKARLLGPDPDEASTPSLSVDRALLLEQLPYALSAAYLALQEVRRRAETAVAEGTGEGRGKPIVLLLNPEKRDHLAFAIDDYLGSLRRAQNTLSHYLSAALGTSIPNSMSDIVKAIDGGRQVSSPAIDALIREYWCRSGESIKHYRDLSDHFAVVVSDARVVPAARGGGVLYLLLPNNPADKSARLLRFGSPPIHAVPFVVVSFADFVRFLVRVVQHLIEKVGRSKYTVVPFMLRGGLQVGGPHFGEPVPTADEIDEAIRCAIRR